MEKAYKYRIYPNKQQKELISKTFGSCRFVYNKYLAMRIEKYEESKESFTYVQCANDMKNLKTELEWLIDGHSGKTIQEHSEMVNKFYEQNPDFGELFIEKRNPHEVDINELEQIIIDWKVI